MTAHAAGAVFNARRLTPAVSGPPPRRPFGFRALLPGTGPGADGQPARPRLIVYGQLAGLLLATLLMGMAGVGLARPLFILGCAVLAWRALRVGPGLHIEVVIALFAFAPFLRRMVDVNAGFNVSGIMLLGPLLALAVPLPELRHLLLRRGLPQHRGAYTPYVIMIACLLYGWTLSAFQGDVGDATVSGAKMFVPILYAMYLIHRAEAGEAVIAGAMRAFIVISPIIGVYGILQYLDPQPWDRYWMLNSPLLTSIGKPEPMQIRVFSTMNSPASFASFAACGLLLFGFCKRGWVAMLLVVPVCLALLLSSYRTAWIAIAVGIVFTCMFNATRGRAVLLMVCLFAAAAAAVLLTPFGDVIGDRLATLLGDPAQDGSGHERLTEIIRLYSDQDHYLFGNGLAGARVVDPQMLGIDGQFVASAVAMGIFIGNIHLIALVWAALQGVFSLEQNAPPVWLVAGAIVVGNVAVLPLAIISSGEVGLPVWIFAALLTARRQSLTQAARGRDAPRQAPGSLSGWQG
jgi:hypothetical protein